MQVRRADARAENHAEHVLSILGNPGQGFSHKDQDGVPFQKDRTAGRACQLAGEGAPIQTWDIACRQNMVAIRINEAGHSRYDEPRHQPGFSDHRLRH